MSRDNSQIWWDGITGPSSFVSSVTDSLMDAKSILLHVPEDLPWRKQMRSSVEAALKEKDPDMMVEFVDCRTDMEGSGAIGDYILQRFASAELRSGYRKSSGVQLPQYIKNNGVINNRIIWVKGMDESDAEEWYSFCRQYHSTSRLNGLFVIENYKGFSMKMPPSYICSQHYAEYVGYFDALLFNSIAASRTRKSAEWKQYISSYATSLCGSDVELSAHLIESCEYNEDVPVSALSSAAEEYGLDKRAAAESLSSEHPFVLLRENRIEELRRAVWKAQMQTIYPLIELERLSFISCNNAQVSRAVNTEYLDFRNGRNAYIHQYGERLQRPEDAEIGTLYRLSKLRTAADSTQYMLFLPKDDDRRRLELLYEMRNSIAHMNLCAWDRVTEFLDAYPYEWENEYDYETVYSTEQH